MKTVNYNEINKVYDDVRVADFRLINHLLDCIPQRVQMSVLDFGCGTGNYTDLMEKRTRGAGWKICGLDPSPGMLMKAQQKNNHIDFRQGCGAQIPWEDEFFDFVYMTDVIHHVPDIDRMFAEIRRVLRPGGRVCIVTQSHKQIEARPIVRFFPGTAGIDKERYPDIGEIMEAARRGLLKCEKQEIFFESEEIELDQDFLDLVRLKGYSMLWILPEAEYAAGLQALEEALLAGPIRARAAGDTLIWLSKT